MITTVLPDETNTQLSPTLPSRLNSSVFGDLTLQESEVEIAGTVERSFTFESNVTEGNNSVRVVLNPDLKWPYPSDAEQQMRSLMNAAERIHESIRSLGTDRIFELHRTGLAELGRYSGYDQWKASEEQLFSEWVLESEIFFDDGFRLIFAGHPIYYLDLLLEFDSGFSPTHVQFDG